MTVTIDLGQGTVLHIHEMRGRVRDEANFEESKHPRAKNGEFAKGSGGGGSSTGAGGGSGEAQHLPNEHVSKQIAEKFSTHQLKGTSSERAKIRALLKQTHPTHIVAKAALLQALQESRKIEKTSSQAKQILANAGIGSHPQAKELLANAASAVKAAMAGPKAPQATPAELEQAKKTTALKGSQFAAGIPEKAVAKFDAKFSGENTPTTTEGLNEKVAAFKELQKQKSEGQKTMEAEQAAKKQAEAKQAAKAKAELHKLPPGDAKTELALKGIGYSEQGAKGILNENDDVQRGVEKFGMSKGEAASLFLYTATAYVNMNKGLRSGKLTPELHELVRATNAALRKMPNYVGVVTRGAKDTGDYEPGMVIEERGFTSSTKKSTSGFGSGLTMKINSKTGKDVSSISAHKTEQEVLFRSGSRFVVTKKVGSTVYLDEVEHHHD